MIIRKIKKEERRYRVMDVVQATGISDGAICGYFSNRGITTKGGLTLSQIVEMAESDRRGGGVDWDAVNEIVRRLEDEHGIIVVRENPQGKIQDAN